MKPFNKLIFALLLCLIVGVHLATAQTTPDPEIKQILTAAKQYAKSYGGTEDKFDFRFKKRVKDYALVEDYPKPKYKNQLEGAQIILKKTGGKWVGQEMGTGLFEWEEKMPELFK